MMRILSYKKIVQSYKVFDNEYLYETYVPDEYITLNNTKKKSHNGNIYEASLIHDIVICLSNLHNVMTTYNKTEIPMMEFRNYSSLVVHRCIEILCTGQMNFISHW